MIGQQAGKDLYTQSLPWDEQPLSLLTDEQQLDFRQQAQVNQHVTGEIIWSSQTPGRQFLVLAGKVRLVKETGKTDLEPGKTIVLRPGAWFGEQLDLVGHWKARAASSQVVVAFWQSEIWQDTATPELEEFWENLRWQYQPLDPQLPHPISGYPYVFSLNSAAACLTMVTQQLQAPMPLKQVQRQVRGLSVQDVVAGAETIGLQLHHIQQISWMGLEQLSFPALLHWRQEHWVVVYEVSGNRMVIADPLNRHKHCESVSREIVETFGMGSCGSCNLHRRLNLLICAGSYLLYGNIADY